jgi:SAM-dependent methyltransferase
VARIRATRRDFVLEIGSGHYPHSTSDILLDRYIEDIQDQRSGRSLARTRPFVCGDIHALPFKDKEFDYVICNQVLEHIDAPDFAIAEITRVGKRGYLSVPSEFYEFICPTRSHRWVFALKDGVLFIKQKNDLHSIGEKTYGGVFHMLYNERDFRRLILRRPELFSVNLEWSGTIPFRILGADEIFYDYCDPVTIKPLIRATAPDDLVGAVQRWCRINFNLDQMARLTRLRGYLRRAFRGKV